ncbi:hypothetical protein [Streptomyces sp. 43Y-GA-1]|uniref:hypothetical protein n=1 Tax=Streptomyces sp. 43Y-GA-1 TaxID=2939435 RepID=UPI0020C0E457|nr:hypothetical protein [Streptomyces sp. 43Y-GA-1]MCL6291670.1 hypothetical protein [Streptomyces sp. 43Y-GA-1]
MTIAVQPPTLARTKDPEKILNAVAPHIEYLTVNVTDGGTLWEREVALLLRDNSMVRNMAGRILGQAVAYTLCAMENPTVHLGVGKLVDIGVHQLILDTPVYWALCKVHNGGAYKHHAPFIERRSDGLCVRTAEFLAADGWDVDDELWAIDGANCSPCDSKVPDSH